MRQHQRVLVTPRVIGIGLYSIFIGRVERLPQRLALTGIDDLKDKLAGLVVVALTVRFFTVALEWSGSGDILAFGVAVAAVVASVTLYTALGHGQHGSARHPPRQEGPRRLPTALARIDVHADVPPLARGGSVIRLSSSLAAV